MELKIPWEVTNCKLEKETPWIRVHRVTASRKIDYNLSSRKSSLTGLKNNIEPLKVAEHSPSRTDISPLHPRWDWKKCGACSIIRLSENICALAEVSIIDFLPFTTQSISHDSCFDLNDPLLRKQRLKRPREKYISKKNFVSAWIEPITSQGGGSGGKDILETRENENIKSGHETQRQVSCTKGNGIVGGWCIKPIPLLNDGRNWGMNSFRRVPEQWLFRLRNPLDFV